MEPAQLISEEWGSLSGVYTAEEADFMAQLLGGGNCSVTEKHCGNASFGMPSSSTFWDGHESTTLTLTSNNSNSYFPSNVTNANFLCFSQGSSSSNESMDEESGLEPEKLVLAGNNLLAKRDYELMMMASEPVEEERSRNFENPTKRLRSSIEDLNIMRNAMPISRNEEGRREGLQISCVSHVDSNASMELNGGASPSLSPKEPAAPNLYGKSKATNGSPATDAQSLYARVSARLEIFLPLILKAESILKRRERINERLKILQTLVPNGTKVDISTMLEEAVQYVKFLQLQIKLLSSDDMWMYAPIAFNGMNIGLGLSISPTT